MLLAALDVEVDAHRNDGSTPLFVAAQNGHLDTVKILLAAGMSVGVVVVVMVLSLLLLLFLLFLLLVRACCCLLWFLLLLWLLSLSMIRVHAKL